MPVQSDRQAVFDELRGLLKPFEKRLVIQEDKPDAYCLITNTLGPNKKPIWFGAAAVRKSYVSYHLVPVYMYPELLNDASPELKARMQGKSCFNFKAADAKLFKELAGLTKKGFDRFKKEKL